MRKRTIILSDYEWLEKVVTEYFASPRIVSRGVLYETKHLPGIIVEINSQKVGIGHYNIREGHLEVVTLIALKPRLGIGRFLLNSLKTVAQEANCTRLWLVTTNNNEDAIRFYEAVGWRKVMIHKDAMKKNRPLKPEIPLFDGRGIPISDEIEYEYILANA